MQRDELRDRLAVLGNRDARTEIANLVHEFEATRFEVGC